MSEIPHKFYSTDLDRPEAVTVGELIEVLKELPTDLEFDKLQIVSVRNIGKRTQYISIQDFPEYD